MTEHVGGDVIEIRGIRGHGFHGVFEAERRTGQEFSVDVRIGTATRVAAARDRLADTVDYGVVAELVHARITGEPCDLIETLAERIAADVLDQSGVHWVDIAVHKPQAPISVPFADVVVRIHRP